MPGKRRNRRGKLRSLLPAVAFLAPFFSAASGADIADYSDTLAWLDAVIEQLDANSLARKAELEAIRSIRVPPETMEPVFRPLQPRLTKLFEQDVSTTDLSSSIRDNPEEVGADQDRASELTDIQKQLDEERLATAAAVTAVEEKDAELAGVRSEADDARLAAATQLAKIASELADAQKLLDEERRATAAAVTNAEENFEWAMEERGFEEVASARARTSKLTIDELNLKIYELEKDSHAEDTGGGNCHLKLAKAMTDMNACTARANAMKDKIAAGVELAERAKDLMHLLLEDS